VNDAVACVDDCRRQTVDSSAAVVNDSDSDHGIAINRRQSQQAAADTAGPGTTEAPAGDDDPAAAAAADGGSSAAEKLGRIQFTLSYDFDQSTLTLKIIRAVELAAKDITGRSDPYVKVMLTADKVMSRSRSCRGQSHAGLTLTLRQGQASSHQGHVTGCSDPYVKVMTRS